MPNNDLILLDNMLETGRLADNPDMKVSDYFLQFTTDLILKNHDITDEEIKLGIVDGGDDGGIDAVYAFVDGNIVREDSTFENMRRGVEIELVVIQAKHTGGFSEDILTKLKDSFEKLLDLSIDDSELVKLFNSQVIRFFRKFRSVYQSLSPKYPSFNINFYIVTKGDTREINHKVWERWTYLESAVNEIEPTANLKIEFLGARSIRELDARDANQTLQINVIESFSPSSGGHAVLVRLDEYFKFIVTPDGKQERRSDLFNANVREYEGENDVNSGIRETLESKNELPNFWWLNNGITIIATNVWLSSKVLSMDNPKIVNGLQTSEEIYKFFKSQRLQEDERLLLLRIIQTSDEEIRNAIIKATNSQSKIPPYTLHATEPIHHNIEEHFKNFNLYYDRQRNLYKKLGKPRSQIVTMPYLAQTVASMLLQRPNDSRGRPTSLIKDNTYNLIFDEKYPIDFYYKCIVVQRRIENYLYVLSPPEIRKERTNLNYETSMFLTCLLLKSTRVNAEKIAGLDLSVLESTPDLIPQAAAHVLDVFEDLKMRHDFDGDRVAKSREFDVEVLKRVASIINGEIPL